MSAPVRHKFRTLDVRPMLARGEEPYKDIMTSIGTLGPNESLLLVTPFLPSPLIEKLQSEGFMAQPVRLADGSWQTQFSRTS